MKTNEELLSMLPFWESLSRSEKEIASEAAVTKKYAKGELVHGAEDECLGAMLVLSGELRVYILSEEGREITLFRLRKGEPCILSTSCVISQLTFDTHIVSEKETEALIINASVFATMAEQNIYV